MGRFISIIDKVFLHFMAIIVIIIAYNSASFSKQILLQEKQYQEGFLVKEVADEITIKELFSED